MGPLSLRPFCLGCIIATRGYDFWEGQGSVFEFLDLIPRLTDPLQFGGDSADAFTVVEPSLPGYGLSFSPGQRRFGVKDIAECFADLMRDVLGYTRFAAQGGDWGSFITSRLAYTHSDRVIGIHLNLMPLRRDPKMVADPTPEERKYLEELTVWLKEGTGYQWIQGTRPQTLAFALTDSPAGLAAWSDLAKREDEFDIVEGDTHHSACSVFYEALNWFEAFLRDDNIFPEEPFVGPG